MVVRKPISQKARFEVFKRDSFTCQYCGSKSPDAVLHVDHIHPVADGGQNDIINLITACAGCNGGKSDILLGDQSELAKQRQQIEVLNERALQIKMLVEWRESLSNLSELAVEEVQNTISDLTQMRANDTGIKEIRIWLAKYDLQFLLAVVRKAFLQYVQTGDDGNVTSESWNKAFNSVPKIAKIDKAGGIPDWKLRAFYIRGILRN